MADQIRIKVIIDSAQAKKGSKESKEYILDIGEAAERTEKQTKQMGVGTVTAGNLMAQVYAKVAEHAMQVIKQTRDLAFNVEETASKYRTVLGPSIGKANKFLEENGQMLGITNMEGQEFISTAVQIAKGMDMQADQAADFGIEWTKLAADFQSFFNVPYEEGFGAIRSGLTGETEPLKRFGIVLREAEVSERALLETGKQNIKQLTEAEKVQARYNLIVEKAGVAVGDQERTQHSASNQTRQMNREFREIAQQMAAKTIPMWQNLAGAGIRFTGVLKDYFGLNVSDQLEDERQEVNLLVTQITSANVSQERRLELIRKLEEIHPDYLEGLDAEKVSNEQLAERLDEVNDKYIQRIALQAATEEEQKAIADQARIKTRADERAGRLTNELLKVNEDYQLGIKTTGKEFHVLYEEIEAALDKQAEFITSQRTGAKVTKNDQAVALNQLHQLYGFLWNDLNDLQEAEEKLADTSSWVQNIKDQFGIADDEEAEDEVKTKTPPPVDVPVVFNWPEAISISEDLKGVKVELEAVPKLTKGSLNELFGKLQNAQAEYEAATTDTARDMWAHRMEMIEAEIAAKEEGISKEQYLRRQAHQEAVHQALEYAQVVNDGFQQITQLQGQVTEHRIQKTQQEKEAAISAIDAKLKNDKLSEQQRQNLIDQREAAEIEYQEKIDKLKREQFERERKAKLLEIAANTAVAISKFWASQGPLALITQGLAVGMGITQAAIVANQPNPYFSGGLVEERLRSGMTSPGKKMISINENNKPEFIMNAASTARSLPVLNRMNRDPDFAERINRQVEQPRLSAMAGNRSRPAENSFDPDALGGVVRSAIREGMQGVIVKSQVELIELKERMDDLEDYQQRIGN